MNVLEIEKVHRTWKTVILNMAQGALKFAVNAATDSIPSKKKRSYADGGNG